MPPGPAPTVLQTVLVARRQRREDYHHMALPEVQDAYRSRLPKASITGKMKTGAQLTAVLLYILPVHTVPGWLEATALGLAVGLTVVSGIQYFMRTPTLLSDAR